MRHLNPLAIIAAVLLGLAPAMHAQPSLETGAESKLVEPEFMSTAHYVGEYQGLYCWIGDGRRHQKRLVLVDHNLQPLKSLTLKHNDEAEVLSTAIDSHYASALVLVRDGRRETKIYGMLVDLDSMQSALEEGDFVMLDSIRYDSKDRCLVWTATSPDRHLMGINLIVEHPKTNSFSAHACVLDARLQRVWEREYDMGSTREMCLANDATMATFSYESDKEGTHFVVNVLQPDTAATYEVEVKGDPVMDMRLAGLTGHHLMAMGTFRPADSRERDQLCGGVVAMTFDIDSARMTGYTMRPFQNEDLNILYNKKTKKMQRNTTPDLVSVVDVTTTGYGAAICLGRNYRHGKTEDNGTETFRYCRDGLHVVAMDTTGEIVWARNMRRCDMQKEGDDQLVVSFSAVGDQTVLLKNEHVKYPSIYDIAAEAKQLTVGDKTNMVCYTIGHDGEVSKTVLEGKTKQQLHYSHYDNDGSLIYYTIHGKRTRMAKLKL